jgi:hypothetical protein
MWSFHRHWLSGRMLTIVDTSHIYGELAIANKYQAHLIVFKYLIRRLYRNYLPLLVYILMAKNVTSLDKHDIDKHDSLTRLFAATFNDNNGIIWWYIVPPLFALLIFLIKTKRVASVYFAAWTAALIVVFCDATTPYYIMMRLIW